MENYYSCIMFSRDITHETVFELNNLIKQGTKCYFFSYDSVEFLKEDDLLNEAIQAQFLFAYEVLYTDDFNTDFLYFNGDIPTKIFNKLTTYASVFNREQFLIEHAREDSNVSVSAGAGTGKTTVMINRIVYLKYQNPELTLSQFALITFTNKAALHMREKLVEKLKKYFHFTRNSTYLKWLQELKNMEIGTIHSFAHKVLLKNEETVFGKTELPISQFTHKRRKIIEEVIDDFHREYPKEFSRFKYIEQYKLIRITESIINRLNHYSIPTEMITNMDFGDSEDLSHELFKYIITKSSINFTEFKDDNALLDVNDLIVKLSALMERKQALIIPYKYIFVDEFQDTDEQQTQFLSFLGNYFPLYLFIVGDVKQSIYRFRGADYTAIDQLKNTLYMNHEFCLQMNYRSNRPLLEKFNELFKTWTYKVDSFQYGEDDYLKAGLEQDTSDEESLVNLGFSNHSKFIEFLRSKENTDTAILVRSNREVNEISLLCEQNNIFYTSETDGDFYRSVIVREFYQLIMRFVHPANLNNRYSLHLSSYGERSLTVNTLVEQFLSDKSMALLLRNVDKKFESYEEKFKKQSLFEVLDNIVQEVNPSRIYTQRFLENRTLSGHDSNDVIRLAEIAQQEYMLNLNHLIYSLKKEMESGIPTLNRLQKLLFIKMQTDKSVSYKRISEPGDKRLTIMTVHKSKGLEFDYVFLPNTTKKFNHYLKTDILIHEGMVGYRTYDNKGRSFTNSHYSTLKKDDYEENIGEETRLLYVAMTRAKKKVFYDAPEYSNNHEIRQWGDLIAKVGGRKENFQSDI